MALLNTWVFYIGVPIILLMILIPFKKKGKYKDGKKIANTSLLEETDYFKKLYREYKIWSILGGITFVIAGFVRNDDVLSFIVKGIICLCIPNVFYFLVLRKTEAVGALLAALKAVVRNEKN